MADVSSALKDWSTTAASNSPADATTVGSGLADNLQEIQKVVRQDLAHKGADIASAGTTDLGAVAGFMHDITGTTTITSFGTVSAGIHKRLQFDGALQITHNATSLICPSGANITTYAGLCIDLVSLGSGNWIITSQLPGISLLETKTASSSTSLDFTNFRSEHTSYLFVLDALVASVNATSLIMRYSTNGGSSFLTTSYSYLQQESNVVTPSTVSGTSDSSAALITLCGATNGISNALYGEVSGRIGLNTTSLSSAEWRLTYLSSGGNRTIADGAGGRAATTANAVRFAMASGLITSGTIHMYGMRK